MRVGEEKIIIKRRKQQLRLSRWRRNQKKKKFTPFMAQLDFDRSLYVYNIYAMDNNAPCVSVEKKKNESNSVSRTRTGTVSTSNNDHNISNRWSCAPSTNALEPIERAKLCIYTKWASLILILMMWNVGESDRPKGRIEPLTHTNTKTPFCCTLIKLSETLAFLL